MEHLVIQLGHLSSNYLIPEHEYKLLTLKLSEQSAMIEPPTKRNEKNNWQEEKQFR